MTVRVPLLVFARPPVPGRAKTRLAPLLGMHEAAALHRAFVADTLATCGGADGFEVRLSCADDVEHPALVELAAHADIERVVQAAGDLGARMSAALASAVSERGAGLVVGSDAPTLPVELLLQARDALLRSSGALVVIAPSADGGYVLIGAGGTAPRLRGVRWSTPHALEDTLVSVRSEGIPVVLLPPWYDVDTPADLRLLRMHLRLSSAIAPESRRALSLRDAGG